MQPATPTLYPAKEEKTEQGMRVAIYARVSTDEQAKHGLSIDTQLANLREWAAAHGHTVVAEYVDAGVSGKKPYTKRPRLAAFFADLENGLRVDALVFTKLDRFFRSVKLYYQAMTVMDKYRVAWQAIQEDYETVTAGGRFKVNIMLSVAESEADRTSERIKVVLDAKKAKREAVTGHIPVGYKIVGKSVVPDEEKVEAVKTLFRTYALTGSIVQAVEETERVTGYKWKFISAKKSLYNRSYIGEFYGIPDYAPAILTREEWDAAQAARKHYVKEPQRTTYIFGGLTRCGCCGGAYGGRHPKDRKPLYFCRRHSVRECENKAILYEATIEQYLLDTVEEAFPAYAKTVRITGDTAKEEAALRKRAAKLQDLYLLDMITLDELKRQKSEIDDKLAVITSRPAVSAEQINRVLGRGWKALYTALDPMGKRMFWRTLIREIRIYPDRHIEFEFR